MSDNLAPRQMPTRRCKRKREEIEVDEGHPKKPEATSNNYSHDSDLGRRQKIAIRPREQPQRTSRKANHPQRVNRHRRRRLCEDRLEHPQRSAVSLSDHRFHCHILFHFPTLLQIRQSFNKLCYARAYNSCSETFFASFYFSVF